MYFSLFLLIAVIVVMVGVCLDENDFWMDGLTQELPDSAKKLARNEVWDFEVAVFNTGTKSVVSSNISVDFQEYTGIIKKIRYSGQR